ncbi:radical SAM family heme chaperone HemW [Brevibacterium paucivorans]|uniref:radical SAM family heme chaperone HemW n=1 Tax=Brevibacterium paucivorans TaxID=170994 RepID=UPI0031E0FE18
MPAQPQGDVPPLDGSLPDSALDSSGTLAAYVHVPYCRVRCGYCDFNTYTATELGEGANREDYPDQIASEIDLASRVLGEPRALNTVFFGGGTPTLLPASVLGSVLSRLKSVFGVVTGAEVTTEANPDTLSPEYVGELARSGFTRVSVGMQSAVGHVLQTLDRTHDPARIPEVVAWVKDAGLQVSLDLIYGTPGESLDDWKRSVDVALECEPDHISAYSLIVEPGTKMGAQVRRGELPMPDEDDLADKYEWADSAFTSAGLNWYEVSNWSRSVGTRCEHNMSYWTGDDWWGFGPGAHSHIGGVRFWNAKHPRAWAGRLAQGHSPAVGREVLDAPTREVERILLLARVRDGLTLDSLPNAAHSLIERFVRMGYLHADSTYFSPTLSGRLMVDYMVRELVDTLDT